MTKSSITSAGTADRADIAWMRVALALAARGLGTTWPNPSVGCVIVKDGVVIGRGTTQPGGRPHAETEALAAAGTAARGATAYVSLEPCAHRGRTPPCAAALIGAGIARVVYAATDSDPRVNGAGARQLADAGIAVSGGVLDAEARELNAGFFSRIEAGRPLVTLKTATTLDGRIAARSGASRWITGEAARAAAHGLRARHDAVLIGAATLRQDDPALTVRLPGLPARPPVRVVLAGRRPLPLKSKLLAKSRLAPVWIVAASLKAPMPRGVEIINLGGRAGTLPKPATVLRALAERGITRLMIEGGGAIAAAFVRAGLVDRLVWFRAASILGGDGIAALAAIGIGEPAKAPRWRLIETRPVGVDTMETYAALR